jgi:hypothetical protein
VRRSAVIVATALLLAGCASGSRNSAPTVGQSLPSGISTSGTVATSSTQQTTTRQDPRATLRDAVRVALATNHRLAIRVLWTNRLPATAARSTRGPALAGMRSSARDRQSRGVRIRMIRDNYRIASVTLERSLATATAVAQSIQTVVPSQLNGRPRGRSIQLHERARIVLRRLDASGRFVVWSITLLR